MPGQVKWAISLMIGAGLLYLGFKVPIILLVFHVIVCFLLAVVVLLQSGTSADLAGAFGGAGSQTAFGPRGAATFLSKATTWCAIMFMLTSLLLVGRMETVISGGKSVLDKYGKPASSAPAPAQKPPQPPPSTPQPNR
ncbi:MAG TPA: preprotein translocase subunit SecG [Candidatus Acidoferrales bacterium]|jgi:preprotein translocase subunit SecG|nr:preprotein translocase subunit SecG [Candidatus Acidoferrales bacterium]